jgi:predicted ATPase
MLCVLDRVTWDGAPVPGERTHALLRALVDAGSRGLSETSLVEEIWADDVPANPAKALQVVVSRARAATRGDAIERTPGGYRLALGADEVDAWALRPEGLRLAAAERYAEALPLLERAQPDDDVVAAILRSTAALHGVPAALERYEAYRTDLGERLGVDPSPALQDLHAALIASDRPLRTGVHHYASSLVGRDDDLVELRQLLREHRVVSILGPGGLGKTRLANLVADSAEQPVVHLVELVGVAAADDLVGEVGSVLGVRDSLVGRGVLTPAQRRDVRSRIAQHLSQAPTLLVLDNCEHLIDAVADLVGFLVASAPRLRVLTTTRAPLAIAAEQVFPLGTLPEDDAVELFRERATAARPGVALPDAAVREIVGHLDGLPLAVELAAVKVRSMSVEDVARRLDNRFTLLRGGDRSAPDRHQTLLAVIDWSWNLLDEPDRRALRRLSVFHDGFDADAAEEVVGSGALDAVADLVDQSLLTVLDGPGGTRYRMLETVREFGRMQLVDAGEDADVVAAHHAWAVGFSRRQAARLFTPAQVDAMDAIAVEENNLADVLRQALAAPAPEVAVSVVATLGGFWTIRGDHPRVIMVCEPLTDALAGWTPPEEYADATRAALCLALLNTWIARPEGLEKLWSMLDDLGPGGGPGLFALVTAVLALTSPDEEALHRAEALAQHPDRTVRGIALHWKSQHLENSGDALGAIESAERALEFVDENNGPWNEAVLHTHLAGLLAQFGRAEEAAAHGRAAAPVLLRLGAYDDALQVRAVLAMAALHTGDVDTARQIVAEIAEIAPQGGFGTEGVQLTSRAEVAFALGDVVEGSRLVRAAADAMANLRFPGVRVDADLTPWTIYGEGVAVASLAVHGDGDDGVDIYDRLAAKAPRAVDAERGFNDIPVIGLMLFALGTWGLRRGTMDQTDAVRLLVLAERMSYPRFTLTMAWDRAVADAEGRTPGTVAAIDAEYGERRGAALLDEARAVALRLFA